MKSAIVSLLVASLFSIVLAACGDLGTPEQLPLTLTAAPCVTATPAAGDGAAAISVIATPAGRTTPSNGSAGNQPTVSLSELATREAQLEQQNRPVQVPAAGQPGVTSLPVCPTATPAE